MKRPVRTDRSRPGDESAERALPPGGAPRRRPAAARRGAPCRSESDWCDADRAAIGRGNKARGNTARVDAGRGDAGSSTAEVAVLLPAVALLLVAGLGIGAVGVGQIQLEEGARAAARELARGEGPAAATAAARRHAGPGARISISAGGEYSSASLSRSVRIPLIGSEAFTLEATAQARTEAFPDAR
ncbi:hypothetical protein GCM10022377_16300 [Zhihengliuella alba]|uniref:Pilus assembly protein n=1 Tax=Zhihengliuella alba TaxID=547018 RepID=A0ABP7DFB8_9MICC